MRARFRITQAVASLTSRLTRVRALRLRFLHADRAVCVDEVGMDGHITIYPGQTVGEALDAVQPRIGRGAPMTPRAEHPLPEDPWLSSIVDLEDAIRAYGTGSAELRRIRAQFWLKGTAYPTTIEGRREYAAQVAALATTLKGAS